MCGGFSGGCKGSVCGVYCPHAYLLRRKYVAIKPVADHDGVCGGDAKQVKGFLIDDGVGFFDAEGFRRHNVPEVLGKAESLQAVAGIGFL